MDRLQQRTRADVLDIEPSDAFQQFVEAGSAGVRFVTTPYGSDQEPVLMPDTGDFAKWLRARGEVTVEVESGERLVLHSSEVWLPLAFLAAEVGLPLYLNLVANYMYERFRGAIRGDAPRVHLSAEYRDPSSGTVKRFEFEGDTEALKAAMKKFDLNEFMRD